MNTRTQRLDLFYEANSLFRKLSPRLDALRASLPPSQWEHDPQHIKLSRAVDRAFAREQRRYQRYMVT